MIHRHRAALRICLSTAVLAGTTLATHAQAREIAATWLQQRDQNPFALASGLPLPPAIPSARGWQIDTSLSIANTELADARGNSLMLFDAETRETRISLAYAFDTGWSLRASLGHWWIGDGVLDSPVESFHRAFGFDNGDRGRLGTLAPVVHVERDGTRLYSLDRTGASVAPLLVDLTRHWQYDERHLLGVSLGAKFPLGDANRLADNGGIGISVSAFAMTHWGANTTFGARVGVLRQDDKDLLPGLARRHVPFASAVLRYRLGQRWSAVVQSDAHGALHRDLPDFFGAANLLSIGVARRIGETAELAITLGEDLPALRTTDVVLGMNLRVLAGARSR